MPAMRSANLELTRAAFEPWQGGRLDEFAAYLDEAIEWDITQHPLPDFPPTGRGRDAFMRHMAEYASGWLDYRVSLVEDIDAGDDVIAVVHETARMRGTGLDLDRDVFIVWTVRGERFTRFRVFKTLAEARAAL